MPPEDQILFRRGDFLTYEFKETFDAVVSLSTIEHVPDVQLFVKRLGQLCRPGGMVFIMTPNDRSLLYEAARPLFALGVRAPFERLYSRHHLHHFNKTSLKRLMEQHGLPIDERFDHNIPLAAVDIPPVSRVQRAIFFLGVIVTFAFGKLTGRTYLQTLVCGRRAY